MSPARRQLPLYTAKAVIEAALVAASFTLAFLLRFEGAFPGYRSCYLQALPVLVLCRVAASIAVTRYRLRWRSTGIGDGRTVALAVLAGSALFLAFTPLLPGKRVPRSVLLMEPVLTFHLLMLARLAVRFAWTRKVSGGRVPLGPPRRVLVAGAGDAGQRIVREMKEDRAANLLPVGYVDDDPAKLGRFVEGLPVLGSIHEIPALVLNRAVDQILIAIPSLSVAGLNDVVRHCRSARADLTILPTLPQIVASGLTTRGIRRIRVEDLLERAPLEVDLKSAAAYTRGKCVLVTGAGGSIGSELCRQLVSLGPSRLVLLGNGENELYWLDRELQEEHGFRAEVVVADVRDRRRLDEIFSANGPHAVFHAAAHKHVPLMEAQPHEAVTNNVTGTRNVAEVALRHGVETFVFVSTDKAVNPTSVMGASKRVAETLLRSLAQRIADARSGLPVETWGIDGLSPESCETRFASVRFGNVLGSNGSVIPTMQRQIERGGPVTVTHEEMVRYFMTIPEAVRFVIQAGAMARGGETFVLDMGLPVRITDLASNLIRLSGFVPHVDIDIEFTGIRPGEKLYEEVLAAEEGATHTAHDRILTAVPLPVDHAAFCAALSRLETAAATGDEPAVRTGLRELVPTYRPGGGVSPSDEAEATASVSSGSASRA